MGNRNMEQDRTESAEEGKERKNEEEEKKKSEAKS